MLVGMMGDDSVDLGDDLLELADPSDGAIVKVGVGESSAS